MAYVFGIEGVPIFEMLFVVAVLLLAGLIFILLELRKLTSIISKEKSDLIRFEDDLAKLENKTGKKSSDKLVGYINTAMARGLTPMQIEHSLVQRGWPKQEVDSILNNLRK